jgi:hypothetical protein
MTILCGLGPVIAINIVKSSGNWHLLEKDLCSSISGVVKKQHRTDKKLTKYKQCDLEQVSLAQWLQFVFSMMRLVKPSKGVGEFRESMEGTLGSGTGHSGWGYCFREDLNPSQPKFIERMNLGMRFTMSSINTIKAKFGTPPPTPDSLRYSCQVKCIHLMWSFGIHIFCEMIPTIKLMNKSSFHSYPFYLRSFLLANFKYRIHYYWL